MLEGPWASGFAARTGLLFIGNGFNPTNSLSIQWFFQAVAPLLWSSPDGADITITLAGTPPDRLGGWSPLAEAEPRVVVLGRVRDLEPSLTAARLFVSPIVVGTGLNVKNLLALEHGLPLVTTPTGVLTDPRAASARCPPLI